MSAPPHGLATALGRILCAIQRRHAWAEAEYAHADVFHKHMAAQEVQWRPGVPVPALSAWVNAVPERQTTALTALEARTGISRDAADRLLYCRDQVLRGMNSEEELYSHSEGCQCSGFLAESHSMAIPLNRGERVAANISDHDVSSILEAQESTLEGEGKGSRPPIPHPACVGLAARRAALAWTEAANAKAFLEALEAATADASESR